jgi:hypothetical protein
VIPLVMPVARRAYDRARDRWCSLPGDQLCVHLPIGYDDTLVSAVVRLDRGLGRCLYRLRSGRRAEARMAVLEVGTIRAGSLVLVEMGLPTLWLLCDIDPPRTVLS